MFLPQAFEDQWPAASPSCKKRTKANSRRPSSTHLKLDRIHVLRWTSLQCGCEAQFPDPSTSWREIHSTAQKFPTVRIRPAQFHITLFHIKCVSSFPSISCPAGRQYGIWHFKRPCAWLCAKGHALFDHRFQVHLQQSGRARLICRETRRVRSSKIKSVA